METERNNLVASTEALPELLRQERWINFQLLLLVDMHFCLFAAFLPLASLFSLLLRRMIRCRWLWRISYDLQFVLFPF